MITILHNNRCGKSRAALQYLESKGVAFEVRNYLENPLSEVEIEDLLSKLDFPLAAPSANPFGSISPTTAEHVANYFSNSLQMVLDGGTCINGIESTIIGFENEEPFALATVGRISLPETPQKAIPLAGR